MDLIYKNDLGEELGVIRGFVFDLAYGKSENDFEFKMPLANHCCKPNYQLFIDSTEYGGIIDEIEVDTAKQVVTYKGRTWHGIMAKKVIIPPAGQSHKLAYGAADVIINNLIIDAGLQDMFAVQEDSGIVINYYQFDRYTDLYSGICAMLKAYNAKIRLRYDSMIEKTVIVVEGLHNYAVDEEWDSDLLDFKLGMKYNPVNHLVCLGSGDMEKRHVIHLFTNKNGVVQDYYSPTCPKASDGTPQPYNDTHFNLTESKKVLFGADEITETYENTSNDVIDSYKELTEKPQDWEKVYGSYYFLDEGGQYVHPEASQSESYKVLATKPEDWEKVFDSFYDANHNPLEVVERTDYISVPMNVYPSGWIRDYSHYFTKNADGTYSQVSAAQSYAYMPMQEQPSDWITNFDKYYMVRNTYELMTYPRPPFVKNKYYAKLVGMGEGDYFLLTSEPYEWNIQNQNRIEFFYCTGQAYQPVVRVNMKIPTWQPNTYYYKQNTTQPPEWQRNVQYYLSRVLYEVPTWQPNTYYQLVVEDIKPAFHARKYFKIESDHYTELVKAGLKRLSELWERGKINSDIRADDIQYDVGDIVGARENVTGIFVTQYVTKKIVTIEDNVINIRYEVGG